MSDQITPAPPAHTTSTSPAPAAASTAPQANFSRPTTANGAPQNPPATAPANTDPEPPRNLNDKLNNVDRYWKFKGAIQVVAIVIALIGIGTIGWCVSSTPFNDNLTYGWDEYWTLWPALVTFAVSVIWCTACILFFVVKKRSVHPGLRVALELLIWLSFIVTALFAMVSLFEIKQWGEYGNLDSSTPYGYSSSYGGYELQPNNTWVWEPPKDTSSSSSNYPYDDDSTSTISTTYTRPCDRNSTSTYSSYSSSYFSSCAEQDAYVNKLWAEKPHRYSVELTGVVCQWFLLVLHFTLFVWACVDCHRYNRSKTSKDAEKIAANIVQTMITNGAIVPPPGQAHLRPMALWGNNQQMGYYQLPQQGQSYPMTAMYPQGQQPQPYQYQPHMSGAAPAAAGQSNEKGEGPRYA